MIVDYLAIGKRVKIARIRKGISQEETAELSGISSRHMSNIETAKTKPSLPALVAIANALDTSVDYFLCDNIGKSEHVFIKEINNILKGCDGYELRIIAHVMEATKESLKREAEIRRNLAEPFKEWNYSLSRFEL